MQANTSLRTKNNILLITPDHLILKKTSSRKRQLIITNVLVFVILGFLLFIFIQSNRGRFKIPSDFTGWMAVLFLTVTPLYFLFDMIKTTINECKEYKLDLKDSIVRINGKAFGDLSKIRLEIFERIGWRALGKAYEIRLTKKWKRKTLSFGNGLNEADSTALLIGTFFGLDVRRTWKK